MKVRIGPWSIERQYGKPYLVDGYQLEPSAWVLRGGAASVFVPQAGRPLARYWAFAVVRPSTVRVTDPLGRRYSVGFSRRRSIWRWGMGLLAGMLLVGAFRLHRHFSARHGAE